MYRYKCNDCSEIFDHDPQTKWGEAFDSPPCVSCGSFNLGFQRYVGRLGYIQGDYLPGLTGMFSHADGKMYDSKSAYLKTLKEKGLTIVGNEKPTPRKPIEVSKEEVKKDVIKAIKQLRQ